MGFWAKLFGSNSSSEDNNDEDFTVDYNSDEGEEEYDTHCSMCGCGIGDGDSSSYHYGKIVCESCSEESELITCDECGNAYESECLHYYEYNGNYYCDNCREANIPDYDDNGNSDWWRAE